MKASTLLHSARTTDERNILVSLLAFAAGDAFGVAYEYLPHPIPIDTARMGTRDDWPLGGVSDDTHLSLITIFAAAKDDPVRSAENFIRDLRAALPRLRGLGPTTKAALGLPPDPGEDYAVVGNTVIGNTNGAMMRTSLLGLGFPARRDDERRVMVAALARATHPAQEAIDAAVLGSALYARLYEGSRLSPEEIVLHEAAHLGQLGVGTPDWLGSMTTWTPPTEGIPLDPLATLAAVIWTVRCADTVLDGYRIACELGGDTDTVAALAGGLLAARSRGETFSNIPWIDEVMWAEIPEIATAAGRLADMRRPR